MLFAYDGRHRCVKRVEVQNGVGRTTVMVWGHEPSQGWGLLEERGPNGELLARHVHGPLVEGRLPRRPGLATTTRIT